MKRIILVGHAASGKDYLATKFIEKGYRKDVSMTTRPMREGEVDGLTYHYVSNIRFIIYKTLFRFYETVKFNEWRYGTTKRGWRKSDVFIMPPSGVSTIKPKDRKNCVIVYINIPEETRRQRMDLRSDADTTERRLAADKKDFKGFLDFDYFIKDPNFDADEWIKILTNN